MKTELAEAKAKWTEEDREKNRKHKEKGGCERCLETPQRLLLSAVFDAVLFDGVTDLDQVAADNHIDRDVADFAWAKCWRLTGEGTCVWCGDKCHSPAPDLDFHLAHDPCAITVVND